MFDGKTSDKKGAGVEEVVEVARARAGKRAEPIREKTSTLRSAKRHPAVAADVVGPILFAA